MIKLILFIVACLYLSGCSENYYIREANQYCEQGEFEKAIECYDKALEINPENYDIYIDKGITYSDMKKEDKAVITFSETINRFPLKAYAYLCRAKSYMRLEKYEKALKDYNSTLKILVGDGKDPFPLRIKGVYNAYLNIDFSEIDDSLDPYEVYADRAIAYYYLDSIKAAWIDLNFCIYNSKELPQCYCWRGFVNFKLKGQRHAAWDDLKKAASLGNSYALDYLKKYYDGDTIKQ